VEGLALFSFLQLLSSTILIANTERIDVFMILLFKVIVSSSKWFCEE